MRLTIDELLSHPSRIDGLPENEARALLRTISALTLVVTTRLDHLSAMPAHEHDELLSADQAAPIVRMHPKTLRLWHDCPFLIVRGRRKLYSRNGLDRWISEQVR
jgi:hypothetical protein